MEEVVDFLKNSGLFIAGASVCFIAGSITEFYKGYYSKLVQKISKGKQ